MGSDKLLTRSMFVVVGLLFGSFGALSGAVLGVGFCLVQEYFGIIRIPVDTLLLKSYPVVLRWADLLAVIVAFAGVIVSISQLTVRSVMKRNKL